MTAFVSQAAYDLIAGELQANQSNLESQQQSLANTQARIEDLTAILADLEVAP